MATDISTLKSNYSSLQSKIADTKIQVDNLREQTAAALQQVQAAKANEELVMSQGSSVGLLDFNATVIARENNAVASAAVAVAEAEYDRLRNSTNVLTDQYTALRQESTSLLRDILDAESAASPESTIKSPEATNPSATDAETEEKYADPTNIASAPDDSAPTAAAAPPSKPTANPSKPTPAVPTFQGGKDHRVRLKVPTSYLVGQAAGPNGTLVKSQGIIFPYTPSISQDYTATYNTVPIAHSNYNQYFYKNSSVGTISLTAKFTVQNDYEAEMYFSIVHLLRALTKMRWGDDDNAGSPPPVCRLYAYGDAIMNNVPVAVSAFKLDLPDSIDYFTTKSLSTAPLLSTFSITLTPIYSRNELQKFTVTDWLSGNIRSKGYL
jgi:hypothetical protein